MTKKDFVAIAEIIQRVRDRCDLPEARVTTCRMAMWVADYCAGSADFDHGRFLTACGVGQ